MTGQPLPAIITIDGPAASGKSTLGKNLADALGYLFFDTGVMYRAVTWAALERGVPVGAEALITALAERLQIDVRPASLTDGRSYDVWVDGRDVTWEIRRPEVDANVSIVSAYPGVRRTLSLLQRRIGLRGQVVMVGRDIGTVVLPEADLKIYLEASVAERARRRYEEQHARGEQADYDSIYKAMQSRDRIDASRDVAPMRPAQDAIRLDSDGIDAEHVLRRVLALLAGDGDERLHQP
jgi:cytidylate kinase